jgi:hypothetical protein
MEAQFVGLEPWPNDSGIIECESLEIGLVDFHNCCDVRGLTFVHAGLGMVIEILFREVEREVDFVLRFKQVQMEKIQVHCDHAGDLTVFPGWTTMLNQVRCFRHLRSTWRR